MRRVLRNEAVTFLAVCLAGWGVSGCESSHATGTPTQKSAVGTPTKPAVAEKADDSRPILSPDLLDHAGLQTIWDQTLPLKEGEKFATVTLLGDRLYLRSDRNYLWSLDRGHGRPWSSAAPSRRPAFRCSA